MPIYLKITATTHSLSYLYPPYRQIVFQQGLQKYYYPHGKCIPNLAIESHANWDRYKCR